MRTSFTMPTALSDVNTTNGTAKNVTLVVTKDSLLFNSDTTHRVKTDRSNRLVKNIWIQGQSGHHIIFMYSLKENKRQK